MVWACEAKHCTGRRAMGMEAEGWSDMKRGRPKRRGVE